MVSKTWISRGGIEGREEMDFQRSRESLVNRSESGVSRLNYKNIRIVLLEEKDTHPFIDLAR